MTARIRGTALKLLALAACSAPTQSPAHSGGLNKQGCHTNHSTGDYHCHRGDATSAAVVPARIAPATPKTGRRVFANCTEARAAGAAPVRRGDPGYGQHLDRDGDGIGSEPHR